MTTAEPRKPRVFAADDPALVIDRDPAEQAAARRRGEATEDETAALPTVQDVKHGIRWGAILLSGIVSLTTLAAGVAWTRFVAQAFERNDWVGWTATGLLTLIAVAAGVLLIRELIGLFRLARLTTLKKDVDAALREADKAREKKAVTALKELYAGRHDLTWGLERLSEHEGDVRDPGDLLCLADRELIAPLDIEARRLILKSAKRVGVVTAMSPMAWVAMLYVVVENVRMLRALAGLYGARPGFAGALRLGSLVVTHIVATGGVALTDDLVGQFLGQDFLRRVSRRLGEGAFNGALTARIGVAAIEVTRPLPWLDSEPIRIRDLLPELLKRSGAAAKA